MKMSLRWFGPGHDTVSLKQIRQIPGVGGVITTLYDKQAGEAWEKERILSLKETVEQEGLSIHGIESVNVSDEIKTAHVKRDEHIENYITTLKNLSECGIHMVCYNFMSVFDWTRTELAKKRPDGSTVLAYDQSLIDALEPQQMFSRIESDANGTVMPGWEPERMSRVKELFALYEQIDEKTLFKNLVTFLEAIMPTCETYGVRMAIHIDDPVWSVFSLPRIVKNSQDIARLLDAVKSPYNGLTLCTGSLSSNPKNDIPAIIRQVGERIHFAHVRNTAHTAPGVFQESAHLSSDGSLDMYQIMKALYEVGFDGPVRPDHGRAIWDEVAMPGYGLYDRALGSQYLLGLLEAIQKADRAGKE